MNRRKFLQNSSMAGMGVATLSIVACNTGNQKDAIENKNMLPKNFVDDFILNETTIADLQKKMQTGQYTSKSITDFYLKRIEALDKNGPKINAVIELNPDALNIAAQMDKERKDGKIRSPLHGIPVLVKDNIDTADAMMTTAGSMALLGHKAKSDAFIVKKLRAAGAVILGKTNLSEWANFRSSHSTSGWSSRGGQTKNPCIVDRNPCGSSSGSGAAVAANFCVVAVGTETDGSVIAPASMCGIVGIKPTVGLLSRSGIIPISATQDTAGPMARSVADAATLLGLMAGEDGNDIVTAANNNKAQKDYTTYLKADGLKGKIIGVEKDFLNGHEGMVNLYKEAIETLKKQGATIVEVELLKATAEAAQGEFEVLQYEFKDGLNRYLANANTGVKSLSDLIAYNKANEATAMPFFKQETLISSNNKGDLNSKEYLQALAKTTSCRNIIDNLMSQYKLHAICGTSIGFACSIDLINGDYDTGFYFCPPAAMAGYPHITVPMGAYKNLPAGLSFIAGAYQEGELIAMAYSYEQASKKRTAPQFLQTSIV